MRIVACMVLVFVTCAASRAFAADAAGGPLPQPSAQPAPPPPAPPPAPYPYPYAYPYAPPPAPGYGQPTYGFNPSAMFLYESQRKNQGIAVVVEFLVPGLGSIYADHVAGAAITWGLMIGGVVIAVWGINQAQNNDTTGSNGQVNVTAVLIGVAAILAGRIYGFVDAYSSAGDYNRALAQRLGLPAGVSLGVTPLRAADGQSVAWAPSLELRF